MSWGSLPSLVWAGLEHELWRRVPSTLVLAGMTCSCPLILPGLKLSVRGMLWPWKSSSRQLLVSGCASAYWPTKSALRSGNGSLGIPVRCLVVPACPFLRPIPACMEFETSWGIAHRFGKFCREQYFGRVESDSWSGGSGWAAEADWQGIGGRTFARQCSKHRSFLNFCKNEGHGSESSYQQIAPSLQKDTFLKHWTFSFQKGSMPENRIAEQKTPF